jgi:hypothetical protein
MKLSARSRFCLCVFLLSSLVALSHPLYSQVAGATLSGTITDAQGAVVPNAKVSVRNAATSVTAESTTNATGFYSVPNLAAGDYEVSISAAGFSTAEAKLTLTVGQKQELNVPLAVGQLAQTVEVTAAVPQVDLASSTISGSVSATTVRELPLNGRDWVSLAVLEPSVELVRDHAAITGPGGAGARGLGDQLSVSGGRPSQNSYRLDGALVNDYSNNGPGSVLGKNLGVDAIQEFSVMTSNYSAEYGFTSGGVINAITKVGTNTFHGSAFEFLRNDKFDAANFFTNANNLTKNSLRQNQFGASGGYRVPKIKTFLFGAYEGVRKTNGDPVVSNVSISDAVRAGQVVNLSTGATVNVAIDPTIQKFLALYPHAVVGSTGCVLVTVAGPLKGQCNPNIGFAPFLGSQKASENFFTMRADQTLTSKDNMFFTYLRDPSVFTTPLNFDNELSRTVSFRQVFVLEETHVFNAAWANTVRVALDRTTNLGAATPIAVNPAAADPSLGMFALSNPPVVPPDYFQSAAFHSPAITLTGTGVTALPGGVGGGSAIQNFYGQIFQLYDDAFSTHGNHGVKFGFAFLAYHEFGQFPLPAPNGTGVFNATGVLLTAGGIVTPTAAEGPCLKSGNPNPASGTNYDPSCGGLVNFLTNNPQAAQRAQFNPNVPTIDSRDYLFDKVFSGYIQDDWKMRSNLTVNLGLRYEMSTIPYEKGANTAGGGPNGSKLIMPTPFTILPCGSIGNTPFTPCPLPSVAAAGLTEPTGDPGSVERASYWTHNPTLKNFEPRIGLAWDPFHNGKTSVRAGIGMFDILPLPYALANETGITGIGRSQVTTLGPPTGIFPSPPQGAWPYVVPGLTTAAPNIPLFRSSWYYVDANIKRNYDTQWNLNVQRQITHTLTVLVGYNGSRSVHNPMEYDSVNTILPTFVSGVGNVYAAPWDGSSTLTSAQQLSRLLNPSNVTSQGGAEPGTLYQSSGWYNGLLVKATKLMSKGFQVQGSFTYSKCIDDSSGSTASDTFSLDASNGPWYNVNLTKGLCDFDVRKNLVVNALWNVPTPKSLGIIGEKILGGWELGTIGTVSSGVPEQLSLGQDILGENISTFPPPQLMPGCNEQSLIDPNYRHDLSYISGFNLSTGAQCLGLVPLTAANAPYCDSSLRGFTAALAASTCANIRGDLGRNVLIGPGLLNIDFSLFKNNYIRKLSETANLQFRAEFFNVTNHTNFSPPSNTTLLSGTNGALSPSLGQITATQGDNRIIQFALKLVW